MPTPNKISLNTLRERLAEAVKLGRRDDDSPRAVLHNTPSICDTPIKKAVLALSLHVDGFADLHTDEQVRLARAALRAEYIHEATEQP